jgi:hypothetical protein
MGRALARLWTLLARPADLATDSVTAGRMLVVLANPDASPPPEREGPSRAELVAALGGVPDGGAGRAADPDDADDDPRAPEALTHG